MKIIAEIISTVFNPLLILVPVPYFIVLKETDSIDQALFWTFFTLIFLLALSIFILIGLEKGFFSDFDISRRKERPLLFTVSVGLTSLYIVLLYFLKAPQILFIASFAMVLGLISIEIVNRYTKASVHVATITAFAASLSLVYGGKFFLTLFLIPLVAWARIITHNHTRMQTLIGGSMGFLITLVVYVIFKYIV